MSNCRGSRRRDPSAIHAGNRCRQVLHCSNGVQSLLAVRAPVGARSPCAPGALVSSRCPESRSGPQIRPIWRALREERRNQRGAMHGAPPPPKLPVENDAGCRPQGSYVDTARRQDRHTGGHCPTDNHAPQAQSNVVDRARDRLGGAACVLAGRHGAPARGARAGRRIVDASAWRSPTTSARCEIGSIFGVRVPREFVDPRLAGHVLSSTTASLPRSPGA